MCVALPTLAQATPPDVVENISDESPAAAAGADAERGDVVEAIAAEDTTSAPALQVTAAAAPESPDRLELHGWIRQSFEVGLARDRLYTSQPSPFAVPYDNLVARSQLLARARYSHDRWFEVNVSGFLSYTLMEQGPAQPSTPFSGFNGQARRGVLEPQLLELFLGLFSSRFDLRIGQQRLAWGRSEFLSPNDVVNARDGRDPLLSELELRTIPTFLVRADIDMDFASLQLVVEPVYVPDRADAFGTNWSGVQPDAPAAIRGLFGILGRTLDPTVREPVQRLLAGTQLPAGDLSEPTAGARLAWSAGSFDVNHYYHYGFDGPFIRIDPRVSAALAATDFSTAGLADFRPIFTLIDAGSQPVRVTYLRRHHIGTDVATTWGPFAIRFDAAFDSKRVFFKRDLQGTTSRVLQGVLAIEYQTGQPDKTLLLEAMYMRLLDDPHAPLLIWDPDSVGIAGLFRWPLWDALSCELRALIGIRPMTQVLQPQVNLKFDVWVLSMGGTWLQGEAFSFGQYFHRNRVLYAKLKGSF